MVIPRIKSDFLNLLKGIKDGTFSEKDLNISEEELEIDEEVITVYCDFTDFSNMQSKIENLGIEIQNSELQRIPITTKNISASEAEKVIKLLDLLEENDDVQQVFHNMVLSEEIRGIRVYKLAN